MTYFLTHGYLEKHATESREAIASAKVPLSWKSDVHFRQHIRSFFRSFSSEL